MKDKKSRTGKMKVKIPGWKITQKEFKILRWVFLRHPRWLLVFTYYKKDRR